MTYYCSNEERARGRSGWGPDDNPGDTIACVECGHEAYKAYCRRWWDGRGPCCGPAYDRENARLQKERNDAIDEAWR